MKTVTKIYYFSPDQFNYFESWLGDMARQGLILKEQNLFTCVFEVGEPAERKYRVIPEDITAISREERSMYEEAGWTYVYSKGLSVFCNEDPEATELFTDVESWRARTRKYRTGRISGFSILFTLWTIYITLSALKTDNDWKFNSAHDLDIEVLVLITAVICVVALITHLVCDIKGIRDFLGATKNNAIEHDAPYKKAMNRGRLSYATIIIMLATVVVFAYYSFDGGMLNLRDSLAYENPHLVRFSEFDENTWNAYHDQITGKDDSGEYSCDYFINTERTLIRKWTHESLSIDAWDPDGESEDYRIIAYYSMEYSEFNDSNTAEKFMEEDIARDSTWNDDSAREKKPEDIRIDRADVDYAGYFSTKDPQIGGNQTLYLRKGKKLIEVYYTGDKDLRSEVDEFAAKLQ